MDEAQIADQLKAKIAVPVATSSQAIESAVNTDQVTMQVETPLDPMVGFKLADVFGINFDPKDQTQLERLEFVYKKAIETVNSNEYTDIVKYLRAVMDMLGARSNRDPLYTIYQWLRLDENRKKIEEEMKLYAHWS